MYVALLIIHILAAVLLVTVILIQRGRGGGLVESFSGVESMFGTKTSQFLTRITAILAILFLFTSITLALLAARQSRSLIDEESISSTQEEVMEEEIVEEKQLDESEVSAVQEEVVQKENIPD